MDKDTLVKELDQKVLLRIPFRPIIASFIIGCFFFFPHEGLFCQYSNVISNYRITHLTTENGLSQNTIDCILKDSRGFMWFGTWNGLNRYDGYNFKIYKKEDDTNSISNNFIYSMCEDSEGNLWIGTRYGLNKFLFKKNQFIKYFHNTKNKKSISDNWINVVYFDKRGQLWLGTNGQGLDMINTKGNPDAIVTQKYNHNTNNPNSLSSNNVRCIFEDHSGRLWIGTSNGLNLFDKKTGKFKVYQSSFDISTISNNEIRCIFEDKNNNLWIGTQAGLNRWDPSTDQFTRIIHNSDDPKSISHSTIDDIIQDSEGNIYMATLGGLNRYNPNNNSFEHFTTYKNNKNSLNNEFINALYTDSTGIVWVGTEKGGINKFNIYQKQFNTISDNVEDKYHLSHSTVNSIRAEKDFLWIGTAGGGLNCLNRKTGRMEYYKNNTHDPNSIASDFITSICRDKNGNLWIGTWGLGFDKFTLYGNKAVFSHNQVNTSNSNSLINNFVSTIYQDNIGVIWIGTEGGLDKFDPQSNSFQHICNNSGSAIAIREVGCILRDSQLNLWIGTRNGLYFIDKKYLNDKNQEITSDKVVLITINPGFANSISENYIISIYEDSKKQIWFGTYGNGLNKLTKFDADKKLFQFEHFTQKSGLSNNVIYGILEDNVGNLWLSTDYGLSKLDPKSGRFMNYYEADGLLSNQFYWTACYKENDDYLYFGGMKGLNYFRPEDITESTEVPRVTITDFKIYNNPVNVGFWKNKRVILKEVISETQTIKLSYHENTFSFEFSALNYDMPEKNEYSYRMVGVDHDWINVTSNRRFASYTKLKGGEYLFQVKASNNDGKTDEKTTNLKIIIKPPFWETIWFIFILIFIALAGVVIYFRMHTRSLKNQKQRLERLVHERTHEIEEQKEKLEKQAITLQDANLQLEHKRELIEGQKIRLENQNREILEQRDKLLVLNKKVKAVNQLKLKFFTNISHEFRTPLTLILGPLEKLMSKSGTDEDSKQTLSLINRNAQRLLFLINQLMDFRKIEKGKMDLTVSQGNLKEFVENILFSFHDLSVQRKISLNLACDLDTTETWFDHEKMENIIYNLLSNAFKYTPENRRIWVKIGYPSRFKNTHDNQAISIEDLLEIQVGDTGIGIEEEKIPLIFKRFYHTESVDQSSTGSGIGLSLTKELVKTHHGSIFVDSKPGKGSVFYVQIPYKKDFYDQKEIGTKTFNSSGIQNQVEVLKFGLLNDSKSHKVNSVKFFPKKNSDKPVILIAEDNSELREFIVSRLGNSYGLLESVNGKDALDAANKYGPDIIVSDIMMPEMDGLELCRTIKENLHTSHIPVILLTAKSSVESQIEGFKTGADDYMPKPFSLELLETRISNLIDSRKKLRKLFSNQPLTETEKITSTPIDQKFLSKAIQYVEINIDKPEIGVNDFAEHMCISRSFLHKKLIALTDQSATDFINTIRLKKSKELLLSHTYNISEIAYAVGYNDPKYFSRLFRKHFGISPTDFIKNQ